MSSSSTVPPDQLSNSFRQLLLRASEVFDAGRKTYAREICLGMISEPRLPLAVRTSAYHLLAFCPPAERATYWLDLATDTCDLMERIELTPLVTRLRQQNASYRVIVATYGAQTRPSDLVQDVTVTVEEASTAVIEAGKPNALIVEADKPNISTVEAAKTDTTAVEAAKPDTTAVEAGKPGTLAVETPYQNTSAVVVWKPSGVIIANGHNDTSSDGHRDTVKNGTDAERAIAHGFSGLRGLSELRAPFNPQKFWHLSQARVVPGKLNGIGLNGSAVVPGTSHETPRENGMSNGAENGDSGGEGGGELNGQVNGESNGQVNGGEHTD